MARSFPPRERGYGSAPKPRGGRARRCANGRGAAVVRWPVAIWRRPQKKTPLLLLLLSPFLSFFFWGGTATQPRNKAEPKSTRRALLPIGNGGSWRPYSRVRLQKRIPPSSLRVFDTNNPNNQNMRFSTQRPSARSTRTTRTTNNRRAGGSRTSRFCSACSCKNRMSFPALAIQMPLTNLLPFGRKS